MNSSVYRRDKDGRIFGTDESKLNPAPNQQISASVDQPKTADNPAPSYPQKIQQPKPQINLGQIKLPEQIKKFFSSDKNKPKTPIGRVTFYAKRIVIFYLIFFVFLGIKTSLSLQKMPASSAVAVEDTAGTNWLLVGSDSREGLTLEEQQQLRTGQDEGAQRTDTIMLVHISNSGTTLVSLPRDSYVYIPEHTDLEGNLQEQRRNKLNAAYSQGGAPLLVETVEFNTGLKIDHYMEIGFKGIRDLTDAVGGVDICVPQDYNDEKSNLNVKAGCQELDGVTALAYVRMRYADPKGDIGRIERQQQYLGAVMKKVSQVTTLLNPIAMYRVSSAGTDSVILGEGDSIKDVGRLGLAMRSIASGSGKIATVPISDPAAETAAGSSVIWDKDAAIEFFAQLAAN